MGGWFLDWSHPKSNRGIEIPGMLLYQQLVERPALNVPCWLCSVKR
jgi:hypothetical protein